MQFPISIYNQLAYLLFMRMLFLSHIHLRRISITIKRKKKNHHHADCICVVSISTVTHASSCKPSHHTCILLIRPPTLPTVTNMHPPTPPRPRRSVKPRENSNKDIKTKQWDVHRAASDCFSASVQSAGRDSCVGLAQIMYDNEEAGNQMQWV